jgi:hypothetical protein
MVFILKIRSLFKLLFAYECRDDAMYPNASFTNPFIMQSLTLGLPILVKSYRYKSVSYISSWTAYILDWLVIFDLFYIINTIFTVFQIIHLNHISNPAKNSQDENNKLQMEIYINIS